MGCHMDHAASSESRPVRIDDDSRVIDALLVGDEATFRSLVEYYQPRLVRLALIYVHDRTLAEDVTQEAWLGMLTGLNRFAGHSSLKTWLFGILINCARASRRRESHTIPFSMFDDPEVDVPPSVAPERFHPAGHRWQGHWATPPEEWPEEHLMKVETRQQVEQAVLRLPPHQRVVVTLRDLDGWTATEVCEVLGITAVNQRVLLHRARSRLRREIDAYIGTAGDEIGHHGN
jgi:RNA polymerase sigma-70 factor (ECF subfamily)